MKLLTHFQTSKAVPLEQAYDYLSILELKLINISNRGTWQQQK